MLTTQDTIYLVCLILSLILTLVAFSLHFVFKRRNQKQNFLIRNGHDGVWDFTKRNFWMFTGSFGLVMIFVFAIFLIS